MVSESPESPSSTLMTEGLLTSRFGSHESVCKPVHARAGQGRGTENSKVELVRRNVEKVGDKIGNKLELNCAKLSRSKNKTLV